MLGFKYSVFQHRHFIPFLSASHCFEHSTFFIYLKHSYINSWLASDQSNLFNLTAFTFFVAIVRSFLLCTVLTHQRGTNECTENYLTEFLVFIRPLFLLNLCQILRLRCVQVCLFMVYGMEYVLQGISSRTICTKYDLICSVFCTGDSVHVLATLCYRSSPDNRNKVLMVV